MQKRFGFLVPVIMMAMLLLLAACNCDDNGNGTKVYLDKTELAANGDAGSCGSGDGTFRIGSHNNIQYYTGIIDDVRIYNRELEQTDVNTLFHEGGWIGN